MPPRKKRKQDQKEPYDEYTEMSKKELITTVEGLRENLSDLKMDRNYTELDRDMYIDFYQNTMLELQEIKNKLELKDKEVETKENSHRVDLKVILKKVQNLEEEKSKSHQNSQENSKHSKSKSAEKEDEEIQKIFSDKDILESQNQITPQDLEKMKEKYEKVLKLEKQIFEDKIRSFVDKSEKMCAQHQQDLETQLKKEVEELDKKKRQHMNELQKNHESQFTNLKNYYDEITEEDVKQTKEFKEKINFLYAKIQKYSKSLSEIKIASQIEQQNEQFKPPTVQQNEKIKNYIKENLKQFEKHKKSLENYRQKAVVMKEKFAVLENNLIKLDQAYERVTKEKLLFEEKFYKMTYEIKQNADINEGVLERRLQLLMNQYTKKEEELFKQIQKSSKKSLNLTKQEKLQKQVQESIKGKNQIITDLKFQIEKAMMSLGDSTLVYQSKLDEYNIDAEFNQQ